MSTRFRLEFLLSETLTEREELILERRLLSEPPETLQRIGEQLGCHRERVRQNEAKALRKLRHPQRMRYLFEEIDERPPQCRRVAPHRGKIGGEIEPDFTS